MCACVVSAQPLLVRHLVDRNLPPVLKNTFESQQCNAGLCSGFPRKEFSGHKSCTGALPCSAGDRRRAFDRRGHRRPPHMQHTCVYVCVYIYICIEREYNTHTDIYIYIYIYICLFCLFIFIFIFPFIFIFVLIFMFISTFIFIFRDLPLSSNQSVI